MGDVKERELSQFLFGVTQHFFVQRICGKKSAVQVGKRNPDGRVLENGAPSFLGCGKLSSSLSDLPIEFVGETPLLAPEPCFLQSDGGLIRRHAQKKCLRLPGEVPPLSRCRDYAEFAL